MRLFGRGLDVDLMDLANGVKYKSLGTARPNSVLLVILCGQHIICKFGLNSQREKGIIKDEPCSQSPFPGTNPNLVGSTVPTVSVPTVPNLPAAEILMAELSEWAKEDIQLPHLQPAAIHQSKCVLPLLPVHQAVRLLQLPDELPTATTADKPLLLPCLPTSADIPAAAAAAAEIW